jgi:DNA-binding MarR family transcriptional regulator
MTNELRANIWPRPRATRKRKAQAQSNATTSEIAQGVDLDGLTSHLGYLIRRAQIWVFQDFIRTLAGVDIRPAQYSVLTVIDANPGLTQAAISNALSIERARLVHLLNGLEARSFVERRPSKDDRRSHALHLTAKGRSALGGIKALAQEHERRFAERVGSKNHRTLLRLLAIFASG